MSRPPLGSQEVLERRALSLNPSETDVDCWKIVSLGGLGSALESGPALRVCFKIHRIPSGDTTKKEAGRCLVWQRSTTRYCTENRYLGRYLSTESHVLSDNDR